MIFRFLSVRVIPFKEVVLLFAACNERTDSSHVLLNVADTTYNATATYTCVTGYVINGTNDTSLSTTCDADGNWTEDEPSCVKRGMM